MDLLWNAYGAPSDQEEDTGQGQGQHRPLQRPLPAPKRFRSEAYVPPQSPAPPLVFPPEPSGRYVSKRERAILAAAVAASSTASAPLPPPHLHPSTSVASPVVGSISDSDLPSDILTFLKCQRKGLAGRRGISTKLAVSLDGHHSAVNSLQWSKSHAVIFLFSRCMFLFLPYYRYTFCLLKIGQSLLSTFLLLISLVKQDIFLLLLEWIRRLMYGMFGAEISRKLVFSDAIMQP
ncbi:unnamed protein product [Musa textilis]